MDELYVLTYCLEDGSEKEVSFTADNWAEAKELARPNIKGGEGLLSCIYLTDGISYWEYDYGSCKWEYMDMYD